MVPCCAAFLLLSCSCYSCLHCHNGLYYIIIIVVVVIIIIVVTIIIIIIMPAATAVART